MLAPLPSLWPSLSTKRQHLELRSTITGFPAEFMAPLLTLAPQLRHITFYTPFMGSHAADFTIWTLLQVCTSLASLTLDLLAPQDLPALLSWLPSHLRLLSCTFDKRISTDESISNAISGALSQPALADLKRWSWVARNSEVGRSRFFFSEASEERWAIACRARGVEPRGDERYYTGEPPFFSFACLLKLKLPSLAD